MNSYGINSRWDAENQVLYFSTNKLIDFPVIISLKEYRSDAVLWSVKYEALHPGGEYWVVPIHKSVEDYSTNPHFMGINVCVYKDDTETLIYEQPFLQKFVNNPRVTLSNKIPYYVNYSEYFTEKKYENWLNKQYDTVVDVGANVGVFSEYMFRSGYAKRIIALECDSIALKDLQNNFKNNCNVMVIPKALNITSEPTIFYQSEINPIISSMLSPERLQHHGAGIKGDKVQTVECITIPQLVDMLGVIDLLKIDIEGAEYDILLDCNPLVFSKINNLLIECHFFEENSKEKYNSIINKLKLLGYSVQEFKENQAETSLGFSECIYASKFK